MDTGIGYMKKCDLIVWIKLILNLYLSVIGQAKMREAKIGQDERSEDRTR